MVTPDKKSRVLFTRSLNGRGTTEAQFRFPAGVVGSFPLRSRVDTPIGSTEFTQQVRLEDKLSVLLTTEKPIYQPGQTIHVRALALDRANHEAAAGRKLTFEVEDGRGNKVFKKATPRPNKFPRVASAWKFALADEVNLGTYHLRALMDAGDKTAEIALNVDKYVLPKFKVALDFSGSAKHGYRPGDHVTGTVRSNYFFGKAVNGAEVTVKGAGMDVAQFEAGSVHGTSDGDGAYRFDIQLPRYLAGRPAMSQGAAARVDRGDREGLRGTCGNARRAHYGERESIPHYGSSGGRNPCRQLGEPGFHSYLLSRWNASPCPTATPARCGESGSRT